MCLLGIARTCDHGEILAFAWQVTPTHKLNDYQKMLRVKENDDVKVVFGFFTFPESNAMVQ